MAQTKKIIVWIWPVSGISQRKEYTGLKRAGEQMVAAKIKSQGKRGEEAREQQRWFRRCVLGVEGSHNGQGR